MSSTRLAVSLAAALCLAGLSPAAQAEQPINIEKWPDDVPCEKLKKHPDGSYEMTVPWARYFTVHTGGKWKNTRETHYWDQKCRARRSSGAPGNCRLRERVIAPNAAALAVAQENPDR